MRWLLVLLLAFTTFAASPRDSRADSTSTQPKFAAALSGDIMDYVSGNRTRMVQVTTIAFGIGLVILMTSTRKH